MADKKYSDNSNSTDDFKQLFADVEPLQQDKAKPFIAKRKAKIHKPEPQSPERKTCRFSDQFDPFSDDSQAFDLTYRQDGVPKHFFKKLQKQQLPVARTLDLHGYSRDQARQRVSDLLDQALAQGDQLLKIIHGHGRGVIKRALNAWLRQDPDVLAMAPAGKSALDSPAVIVLIKYRLDQGPG